MKRIAVSTGVVIGLMLGPTDAGAQTAGQVFNHTNLLMIGKNTDQTITNAPANTVAILRAADAAAARLLVDNAGAAVGASIVGRTARNTIAAPSATQSGDLLLALQGFSYGATGYNSASQVTIGMFANQDQTDTARGSRIGFFTTPDGSTTLTERLRVAADGTVQVFGTTSGTVTLTPQAAAGTPTLTYPNASGTFAVSATSPLSLSATTGALTCSTCGVTSSGLNQFASTTSAQFFGVISDETGGSGVVVGNASPTFTTQITSPKVIGGTGTTDALSLQSTSGAGGTSDKVNIIVGNNGAKNAMNVYGTGLINVGATDTTPDSLLTVMANTAAAVAPLAGTHVHIVGADAAATRLTLDNFGSANVINARHASGTLASKTASASGSTLFAFGVAGWDGTSAYYSAASLNFVSTETFSTTAGGSEIQFFTTPNTTHTNTQAVTVQNSGCLSVGSTTACAVGQVQTNSAAFIIRTRTAYTNGAGALTGTLTNSPVVGNPTKWIPVDDAGTTRYIPAW